MTEPAAKRQQARRKKMRDAGFILFQTWILEKDKGKILAYINKLNKKQGRD